MIKLSTLDPEAVADEVLSWVQAHVGRLLFAAGYTDPIAIPGGSLRYETALLVHYAQTGELPDGEAPIQTIVESLYSAAHPDVYSGVEGDWAGKDDPRHAIDASLRGALARSRIDDGGRVPLAWLAVLAELPVQTVRTYATRGELRHISEGTTTASEARRWLGARGVPGYREKN